MVTAHASGVPAWVGWDVSARFRCVKASCPALPFYDQGTAHTSCVTVRAGWGVAEDRRRRSGDWGARLKGFGKRLRLGNSAPLIILIMMRIAALSKR
ncbi:MAG: hypothetical protein LBK25_06350 [Treponema sp.]|nr:hypothetical protein [Treponema sp.]